MKKVVASVPHDIHELLETASKLVIIPTNFSFFLKYGRDEKSFAPVCLPFPLFPPFRAFLISLLGVVISEWKGCVYSVTTESSPEHLFAHAHVYQLAVRHSRNDRICKPPSNLSRRTTTATSRLLFISRFSSSYYFLFLSCILVPLLVLIFSSCLRCNHFISITANTRNYSIEEIR